MFGLFDLLENTAKVAINVVDIPATIVNRIVVKPIADATKAVADEIHDLTD